MANYTAADVKRLRELTGAGMMDCKKALDEADGDFDKAVEFLRIKGAKDVGKRAERTTANGLVAAAGGAMIELNCETDFVAKNADFQAPGRRDRRRREDRQAGRRRRAGEGRRWTARPSPTRAGAVRQDRREAGAAPGRRVRRPGRDLPAPPDPDLPPSVGVLVEYTGDDAEAARGAAMQIAAMKPRYVTRDEVPEDVVATERRIAEETAREEGKPEQALPKIVEGRVNGFYKDAVLLEQSSVQDSKKTVKAVLDAAGVTVTRFARFEVGQS